jgi:hypothetical protein
MPQVWFEPTTLLFERAKTVHTLDSAAIVKDNVDNLYFTRYISCKSQLQN